MTLAIFIDFKFEHFNWNKFLIYITQVIQEMQRLYQCNFKLLSGGVIAAKITSIVSWKKVPQVISNVYGE